MHRVLTKERLKSKPFVEPMPHVVILGAGASKQAFLKGDRNGMLVPLMNELPMILGDKWKKLVQDASPPEGDFESQFSWLKRDKDYASQLLEVEEILERYFEELQLPDHPTIYDYLVLGLRGKDIIATFNWDPFLIQAHKRNNDVAELPDIRFLHGCVAFATCDKHDILGMPAEICPKCNQLLSKGRLFFPDEDKDYASDELIQRDWKVVTDSLERAFHLTIFGYAGPATDYKARKLILDGWECAPMRPGRHLEIIDIANKDILRNNWAEYKISASKFGIPSECLGPFITNTLKELQDWFSELN